jgi:hypothetical protein
MRSVHALLLAIAIALPAAAGAKAWQGITPGSSTRDDVLARFGEPSTQGPLGGQTALVYRDDRAIGGTRQAQFLVGDAAVVSAIDVFPATALDRESVEGTYGKPQQKSFTEDFRPVWVYRSLGVMVFFGKEGHVDAIRFEPAAPTPSPDAGARRRAGGAPSTDPAPRSPSAAAPPPRSPATAAPASPPPPASGR